MDSIRHVEKETEAKAAGNRLRIEGLEKQVTTIVKSQEILRVLLSDLIDSMPLTEQNWKGGLNQPNRRSLRARKKRK